MSGELKIFLSQVTSEFRTYRDELFKALKGPRVTLKYQEDFINLGGNTLAMLDEYISQCNCVIHLVGKGTGSIPVSHETAQLKLDNLADTVPFLPEALAQGETFSYTQWEAYLALHRKVKLHYFVADTAVPGETGFQPTEQTMASQQQHRQRLESIGRYGKSFSDSHQLFRHVAQELINNSLGMDFPTIQQRFPELKPIPNNLPPVGSLFKGRDAFLEQLHQVLRSKPSHIAAVTARQAIHGLGGIGKTRVAVEYGRKYADEYSALLFITADSPTNLDRNLASLCGAMVLNLPEQDAREQEVQVNAALRWLRSHTGWFLIVDNVDTEDVARAVEDKLTHLNAGHIVITSRLSQWQHAVESLELNVLAEADAQAFLLERTEHSRTATVSDGVDAVQLANDLGCLPLALEQAGSFIVEDGCSLAEYRQLWKSKDHEVVTWHDERMMKYPRSLATTWQTSFDNLSPDAQGLMHIVCWLAPDPIPLTMLEKLKNEEGQLVIDIHKARRDLLKYSFFKWSGPEHEALNMHRLVQEVAAYRLEKELQASWVKRALQMVNEFVVGDPYDVRIWKEVYTTARYHMAAVVTHADQLGIAEPTARLMNELAAFSDIRAEFAVAEPLLLRALAIDEKANGTEHPDVARDLNNLSALLLSTNRMAEAEQLMRRALAINEKWYGPDHPTVAINSNILALSLYATHRLREAELLMHRALAIDEKFYGLEHPKVASDLNDLASLLQSTNRLGEAEPLMRRALAINEKWYGPVNREVAISLNNLCTLLQATNRLGEAEPLLHRSLLLVHNYNFKIGNKHPFLTTITNNYTSLLRSLGRTEVQIQQTLGDIEAEAQAKAEAAGSTHHD